MAKLDSSGTWRWAFGSTGLGTQQTKGVAVDGTGRVYLPGWSTSDTLTFGGITLVKSASAAYLGFLARVNPRPNGTADEAAGGASAVTVWPNPAHGQALVRLPAGTAVVSLLDPLGRVVRTGQRQADQEVVALDLRGLAKGIYVVKVGLLTTRLVVE